MTTVRVLRPGLLTLVQDLGRRGYEEWGVGVGGVVDEWAAFWANWLLRNFVTAALLEVTGIGGELEIVEGGPLARAGADFEVRIDGEKWENGTAVNLPVGARVRFGRRLSGLRCYLAFPGGIDVPLVLHSRSTDMAAGWGGYGGHPLRVNDRVCSRSDSMGIRATSHTTVRISRTLRVLPGARLERFPPGAFTRILTRQFVVSPESSAAGIRLQGSLGLRLSGSWPSEGMAIGAVQCLPGGEPLILLKNRGTIGGYPVVAHVIRADWPALAQLCPGDAIQFEPVSEESALLSLARQRQCLGALCRVKNWEIPAPFDGLVDARDIYGRTLASQGEWVYPGQLLFYLRSLGYSTPILAPVEGLLTHVLGPGALAREGVCMYVIRQEVAGDAPD